MFNSKQKEKKMKVIWSWLTNEQVFIISMYCLTTLAEVWYCLAVFHLLKLHSMLLKASTFLKGRAEGQVGWSVALFAYMHAYIIIDGCMRGDKGNFHDLCFFVFVFFLHCCKSCFLLSLNRWFGKRAPFACM